ARPGREQTCEDRRPRLAGPVPPQSLLPPRSVLPRAKPRSTPTDTPATDSIARPVAGLRLPRHSALRPATAVLAAAAWARIPVATPAPLRMSARPLRASPSGAEVTPCGC